MRSIEAIPGKTYRLRRRDRIKVELLDTPPEVRAARRMRVKFLSGVKAGTVTDVPSAAIAPPPGSDELPRRSQEPERPASLLVPSSGPIRQGATVVLDEDKAGFHWTVKRLLPDGMVEITTKIFERPTTRTVGRDCLQLVGQRRRPASDRSSAEASAVQQVDTFDQSKWVSKNLSPDRPRRHLDIVAESIVLGPRCLDSCRNRFYRGLSDAECADRFRAEIRTEGVIQGDRKRGKLEGRIRVHRRFELILPDDFQAGDLTTIESPSAILDLRPRSERPKKRPRSRRRRPKRPQSS
jgi:hypothetical protein